MERLPLPPEPRHIRKHILAVRAQLGPSRDVDWDSLAAWYGNRVPQYLWTHWKSHLGDKGLSWQGFLRLMKNHTDDVVLWADGKLSWEDFLGKVAQSVEEPSRRVTYSCPVCSARFAEREAAREHIKAEHAELVQHVLSRLKSRRLRGLRSRNIDPENWAAGYVLSMYG